MKSLFKFFLIVIALALPFSLSAAAKATFVLGNVSVQKSDGAVVKVKKGQLLARGDKITTGGRSLVIITIDNKSKVKMRENSSIALNSITDNIDIYLTKGSIFSKVTRRKFQVSTPTIVAAVRGTEYFVAYGRDTGKGTDLWMCVNEGVVNLASKKAGKSVDVKKGEGVIIMDGVKLTKPKEYAWTKDLNWNTDPDKGNVIDKTSLDKAYNDLLDQDYD